MKRFEKNKSKSGSRTLCVEQVEGRLLLTASGGGEASPDVSSQVEPGIVNLVYDPSTGDMSLDTGGLTLTTLELVSADSLWRGDIDPGANFPWPGFGEGVGGPFPFPFPQFDVYTADKAFNLVTSGFGNLDPFGAMDPGLSCEAIAADLTANGSLLEGGGLPGFAVTGCDVPPEEAIENLAEAVSALDLANGTENALLSSITGNGGALAKLQDDNPDNDQAAIGKLQAFINKVEAQRGKRLTDEQADALAAAANDIIDDLNEELDTPDEELSTL